MERVYRITCLGCGASHETEIAGPLGLCPCGYAERTTGLLYRAEIVAGQEPIETFRQATPVLTFEERRVQREREIAEWHAQQARLKLERERDALQRAIEKEQRRAAIEAKTAKWRATHERNKAERAKVLADLHAKARAIGADEVHYTLDHEGDRTVVDECYVEVEMLPPIKQYHGVLHSEFGHPVRFGAGSAIYPSGYLHRRSTRRYEGFRS